MANVNSIGKVVIDLVEKFDKGEHTWAHIESDKKHVLIGMYEDGVVARQLFFMSKAQTKQLANILSMLADTMDE